MLKQVEFYCYDQQGCRMLQKKLDEDKNNEFKSALIECIAPVVTELMMD